MPVPAEARPVRIAFIDDDSGLITILQRRFEALHWDCEVMANPPGPDRLAAMRLQAIGLNPEPSGSVIYQRVWGYAMVRGDRSVDVFVRKLRRKLERISPGWSYVHTHVGVGYRFAAERAHTGGEAELSGDRSADLDVRLGLAATS